MAEEAFKPHVLILQRFYATIYNWQDFQSDSYFSSTARFGYDAAIIARPALPQLLLDQFPSEKVQFGKRIVSRVETEDGVTVKSSDGLNYHGTILVDTDGAYSGVRQSLYEQLDKEKALPPADKEPLKFSDDKVICWMGLELLDEVSSKEYDTFKSLEWGSEAAESMVEKVRDFPVPCGEYKTLGSLIDLTPKDLIFKAVLEEKFPSAWRGHCTDNRKPSNDQKDITNAFQQYQDERIPLAKAAVKTSASFARLTSKTWYSKVIREMIKYIPHWLWDHALLKSRLYRPQLSFLPPVSDHGSQRPLY
ncbi:hypothetical protein BC939DRAFT_491314 [Gamsiella multidivaricata]|uniref:uncharacterized protein n=1 Tax=Gamsiella multidivaricata TaxID=101098 RepID=UPI00221F63FF|nr:uncharacterized protein BC939DRAFT_491314 [Gamsiella multidivaricata]KAI7827404.1 hypothetical protein BC939DRAFT_491314 [Gamsiella multidivaricata]